MKERGVFKPAVLIRGTGDGGPLKGTKGYVGTIAYTTWDIFVWAVTDATSNRGWPIPRDVRDQLFKTNIGAVDVDRGWCVLKEEFELLE